MGITVGGRVKSCSFVLIGIFFCRVLELVGASSSDVQLQLGPRYQFLAKKALSCGWIKYCVLQNVKRARGDIMMCGRHFRLRAVVFCQIKFSHSVLYYYLLHYSKLTFSVLTCWAGQLPICLPSSKVHLFTFIFKFKITS